jgi:hypothetical protein
MGGIKSERPGDFSGIRMVSLTKVGTQLTKTFTTIKKTLKNN